MRGEKIDIEYYNKLIYNISYQDRRKDYGDKTNAARCQSKDYDACCPEGACHCGYIQQRWQAQ
jgi:hypothetical protein